MTYEVSALSKSIAVLKCLAASDEALGVSEIVRRTMLSKNMVFRICQTLCEEGWLAASEPGPVYRLTLVPFHLFAQPLERSDLHEACLDQMQFLRRETGETIYVSVRDQDKAVNVALREGSNPLRVAGRLGAAFDLHSCAQGKIFLAYSQQHAADLRMLTLKKYTEKTITSKKELAKELKRVRDDGFAINDEEFGRGLLGCAAPIFDQSNACIAAIGMFATTTNITTLDFHDRFAPIIKQAAAEVSHRLGFLPNDQEI